MNFRNHFFLAVLLGTVVVGCKKDTDVTPTPPVTPTAQLDIRDSVYAYSQLAYLWADKLPAASVFKPQSFATPVALIDGIKKYSPLDSKGQNVDKWSYITTISAYNQQQQGGQSGSTGLSFAFVNPTDLRVRFVLPNSPADQQGITRGWKVVKVNGVAATNDNLTALNTELGKASLEMELQDPSGNAVTKTVTRGNYSTKMVFDRRVLNVDGKKVGYLNLYQFVESANAELTEAFNLFQNSNISDLVIDLRYNGGGNLIVAEHFANLLAPTAANGKVFYNVNFNDKLKATSDRSYTVKKSNSLNLSRVFFITSQNTASASELMINGLKPYAQTILIGDRTYGKPVGQSARQVGNYYPFTTAFKYTNASNEGDFFDGLPVQKAQIDDVTRAFGDPNEARLAEAIYFVRNGLFRPARTSARASAAAEAATAALNQEPLVLEGGATLIQR